MNDAWDALLAGEASAEALHEAARRLHDPAQARELLRAAADEWALGQAARGRRAAGIEADPARPTASTRRHPTRRAGRPAWRRGPGVLLLAVTAVVIAVVALWPASPPPDNRLAEILSERVDAGFAADLRAGRPATLPAGETCELRLTDGGSRLALQGPTRLQLRSATRVQLQAGTVRAEVVPQAADRAWQLDTPHATCRVLGTAFTVDCQANATVLRVHEGRVRFGAGGTGWSQEVGAGELGWSRSASALLYYPFAGSGGDLLTGTGLVEVPPLQLADPARSDGGLLLDPTHHCVTATHAAWPELARRLREAPAITLMARCLLREPAPAHLLLAEIYAFRGPDRDPVLFQLRLDAPSPAGEVLVSGIWHADGRFQRHRDGRPTSSGQGTQRLAALGEIVQLKLYLPAGDHVPDADDPAVVFHDLWLFDHPLEEAALLEAVP